MSISRFFFCDFPNFSLPIVQMSWMRRLVKCWLRWAAHLVRLGEERMAKRADRLREQGRRKIGRSLLIWQDCVRKDIL